MKTIFFVASLTFVVVVSSAQKQRSKPYDADFKQQSQYSPLYTGSYALVVGVNNYSDNSWPDLDEANRNAQDVADALKNNNFTVDLLLNPSYDQLLKAMKEFEKMGKNPDDQLLFYFAGHGVKDINSDDRGYVIPADAPTQEDEKFLDRTFELDYFLSCAERIVSKHVLFMFDSCFGGTIFETQKGEPVEFSRNIETATTNKARQFITSGAAEEEVPDDSRFCEIFLDAINPSLPEADCCPHGGDGYVTFDELKMYIETEMVERRAKTSPQFGSHKYKEMLTPGFKEGDFVFQVPKK